MGRVRLWSSHDTARNGCCVRLLHKLTLSTEGEKNYDGLLQIVQKRIFLPTYVGRFKCIDISRCVLSP